METCCVCNQPVNTFTQAYERDTIYVWHIECFKDKQGNLVDIEQARLEMLNDRCQDAFWNCDTCLCEDNPYRHVIKSKDVV